MIPILVLKTDNKVIYNKSNLNCKTFFEEFRTNTEMHIWDNGTVLIVFLGVGKRTKYLASFNLQSHKYSLHLSELSPYCSANVIYCQLEINQRANTHKNFHHWPVLLYTFNWVNLSCLFILPQIFIIKYGMKRLTVGGHISQLVRNLSPGPKLVDHRIEKTNLHVKS